MRPEHPDFEAYIRGAFFGGFEDVAPSAPQTLLPLERFDYETLRRTPERINEFNAHRAVRVYVRKNLHLPEGGYGRASAQLLKALRDGNLDREQRLRFNRILSGMRSFERHLIYRSWGLSIFELASVVAQSYGGRHGIAPWLNLWGTDPQHPLPDWDGLTMKERARRRGFIIENGQIRRTKQKTESQVPIGITERKPMPNADGT